MTNAPPLVAEAITIVNLFTRLLTPSGTVVQTELGTETLLGSLKFYAGFTGLVLALLVVLSGLFLIPSAGSRWMLWMSKALLTVAALYGVFMGVVILV